MQTDFSKLVATSLSLSEKQVARTLALLNDGATIPFISRYRKEATGCLNEVQIGEIKHLSDKYNELLKRKTTIITAIESKSELTDALRHRIESCWDANELEDIYLPFKPKRRTRAEIAKEKGLEPLAHLILQQKETRIREKVKEFINDKVSDETDAP